MIFSQFGKIHKCNIVKDWKTGDSLQYGFIEFETIRATEEAYLKMQNCLIDNHRIKVDFSQSVMQDNNKGSRHRTNKKNLYKNIRDNLDNNQSSDDLHEERHKKITKGR